MSNQEAVQQVVAAGLKTTSIMTYGGAAGAVWFGRFTTNEMAAMVGAIVAVVGLVINAGINIWFKKKQLDLYSQKGSAKMDYPEV